jgi:hypothetical protein
MYGYGAPLSVRRATTAVTTPASTISNSSGDYSISPPPAAFGQCFAHTPRPATPSGNSNLQPADDAIEQIQSETTLFTPAAHSSFSIITGSGSTASSAATNDSPIQRSGLASMSLESLARFDKILEKRGLYLDNLSRSPSPMSTASDGNWGNLPVFVGDWWPSTDTTSFTGAPIHL